MCAGYNHYGQLGFGNNSNYAFLDYVNIPNGVTPSVLFSSQIELVSSPMNQSCTVGVEMITVNLVHLRRTSSLLQH